MIRTTNNRICTLLFHGSLPPSFWVKALHVASYLHNILPSKLLHNSSPTQALYRVHPTYSHLCTIGCLCFPNVAATMSHKLSPQYTPYVVMGYPSHHRGYRCLDLATSKVIVSRHVTFDESVFPFRDLSQFAPANYSFLDDTDLSITPPPLFIPLTQSLPQQAPPSPPPSSPFRYSPTPPPPSYSIGAILITY